MAVPRFLFIRVALVVLGVALFATSLTANWAGIDWKGGIGSTRKAGFLAAAFLPVACLALFARPLEKWLTQKATVAKVILASALTIFLFEIMAFLLARYLPLQLLWATPAWVQRILPERAFERENFRTARRNEFVDDPIFAWRYAPDLDAVFKSEEFSYRLTTDSRGFANPDEGVYDSPEVVVIGDSFTMGSTVNPEQSWPRQLSKILGLRILNLGMSSWDVYQYPRALEKYAAGTNPAFIIVGLTTDNDLYPRYYDYNAYRLKHDGVKGFRDFLRRTAARPQRPNFNFLRHLTPFTYAASGFVKGRVKESFSPRKPQQLCEFVLNGKRLRHEFRTEILGRDYRPDVRLRDVSEDLERIRSFAVHRSSKLYYVYFPRPEEVYIPLLTSATEMNGCSSSILSDYLAGQFDMNLYFTMYKQALGKNSDLLLNATPYLQRFAKEGERLFWTWDFHPNALGHRRIAEYMASRLGR